MFSSSSIKDWESLVKKQLKSEDIYSILSKENLENIKVNPYYESTSDLFNNLPKVEESTHLVAQFHDSLQDHAFAFVMNEKLDLLSGKTIFIDQKQSLDDHQLSNENTYFSLIDVFENNEINTALTQKLLSLNLQRNICIDTSLYQNAGASIIQQLAYAIAKAKDLMETFGEEILDRLIFKFAIGGNYFFEIAKIRAFKLLFYQFSAEYGKQQIPFIFSETSMRNKSIFDEENNLIRTTLELSAAMIAGSDAVFAHDYKIKNSTDLSSEIAFKQQLVLAYESIINVFEDAPSGSYYVEHITQQFSDKAWQLFLEMEEAGGFLSLLVSGDIAQRIYEQATKEQQWIEEGKIKLIGVNQFPCLEKKKSIEQLYQPHEIKPVRWAEMFE